jgi:hypothetical protein
MRAVSSGFRGVFSASPALMAGAAAVNGIGEA